MRVAVSRSPGAPLRQVVQMGGALAASDLVRGAIRLATSLVIARGLGRDAFGRWTLYAAWASALTVAFDFGLGVLLTRETARDDRAAASMAAAGVTIRLVLFAPVAAVLWIARGRVGTTADVALAVAALAAAGMAYGCVGAVFRADPARLFAILAIEGAGALAQCGGAFAVVTRGGTIVELLWLATAILIAELAIAWIAWRAMARENAPARPSVASAVRLLHRALPFAAAGIVANVQARLSPLMLGYFSGAGELAAFGVASRIESVARRLPYAAFGAALPVFSAGRAPAVRSRFNGALRWFAIVAGVALAVFAAPIVRVTYGRAFDVAAEPLMWAGAALVPSLVNSGRKVYLNAIGHERKVVRWSAVALGVQAAAAIVLMPRFGAVGAMWAIGLGELAIWAPLRSADSAAARAADVPAPGSLPALSA